jgi:hypothetical protein
MTLTADDLARAGWRRVLRLVTLPAGPEADMPYWRDPDGRVLEESAALAELREQAEEEKE